MAHLELSHIVQRYDQQVIVDGISLVVQSGQIACLLGPSGCGKTTLLRAIAGFEDIASGEIRINGEIVTRPGFRRAPEQRQVGMVFQDYALFPHLTVAENVGFGLHRRSWNAREREQRILDLLHTVGLNGAEQRYPNELSGGQQQRVALARALAPRPQLILLDEPFSNLDVDLRERLSLEVRDILKAEGATAILVTHDQHEAFAMADEIGILSGGHLQQWDIPYNLYHRPANRFVADFVGQGVLVQGEIIGTHQVQFELGTLETEVTVECSVDCPTCQKNCRVDVLLRPDDIVHDDQSPMQAEVAHKAFRGADILYTLRLDSGTRLLSLVPSHHNHAIGEKIGIRLAVDHVVTFKSHRRDCGDQQRCAC